MKVPMARALVGRRTAVFRLRTRNLPESYTNKGGETQLVSRQIGRVD